MKMMLAAALLALPQALAVDVSAKDPSIRYVGRWDTRDVGGPRAAWAGSAILARFQGTAVNAVFKFSGNDQWQVVIDGQAASIIAADPSKTVYPAASGLSDREHTIELFKRTEPLVGTTQFLGLQVSKGKLLPLPARPRRRIEIVGDSISCGYGNESASQNEKFAPGTENNYLAYGAVAARALNAEYVAIAWSGKWLFGSNAIPLLYDLALPNDPQSRWDFSSWTADAVVVNLGTNDFGPKNPSEKEWTDAFVAFIKRIRTNYPQSHIFLAVGSMMSDGYPPGRKALSTIRGYNQGIVSSLLKEGDKKLHYVEFEPQDQKNGIGGDWHPSVKTHKLMADVLTAAIKKELGW
jgi:lysophospholipase L1-like esterase